MAIARPINTDKARAEFFESIFGTHEGYICIATARPTTRAFNESYFEWPKDVAKMMKYINEVQGGHNVWFCAQLLDEPKRVKENVGLCYALWADLDACPPTEIIPRPPVVIQTSEDRWHAYWPLTRGVEPQIAEDYSHRIAYAYKEQGVDQSGWDLTQILRVPFTFNYKYPERPQVTVEIEKKVQYDPKLFEDNYPHVPNHSINWVDAPERLLNGDTVMAQYRPRLEQYMIDLYADQPSADADWSAILWKFMTCMFEIGMNSEEVYAVASQAACNKFLRDGKPERLWPDVLRAESSFQKTRIIKPLHELPEFDINRDLDQSFIEDYTDWASLKTDAPQQYHHATAFIVLSSLLSSSLEIETRMGMEHTNLWVCILGETTLTRKTTSMKLGVKLIRDVDENLLLATTEGSVEGIMSALESRPHRASLYFRDEISGMFKATVRKDYLSGMLEAFTKLYDGDDFKRLLRKEVINVREPIFIFFGGGIKNATLGALQEEHLTSGFIPRFLWVIGETTLDQLRPLGPPTDEARDAENYIIANLRKMYREYNKTQLIQVGGEPMEVPLKVTARLTNRAWELWNLFQGTFQAWANEQAQRDAILPIITRSCDSCLKMAALVAASRQEPDSNGRIEVNDNDVAHAIKYVRAWMPYTIEVIRDVGVTEAENLLQRVLAGINRQPGVSRSTLMRSYRLSAREMNAITETLMDRMLIRVVKEGRQQNYYPATYD